VTLLALDDFGAQSDTAWAREKLYQLVNYRVNHDLPTVVTSNWTDREFAQYPLAHRRPPFCATMHTPASPRPGRSHD
jgi:hypothetical protein